MDLEMVGGLGWCAIKTRARRKSGVENVDGDQVAVVGEPRADLIEWNVV